MDLPNLGTLSFYWFFFWPLDLSINAMVLISYAFLLFFWRGQPDFQVWSCSCVLHSFPAVKLSFHEFWIFQKPHSKHIAMVSLSLFFFRSTESFSLYFTGLQLVLAHASRFVGGHLSELQWSGKCSANHDTLSCVDFVDWIILVHQSKQACKFCSHLQKECWCKFQFCFWKLIIYDLNELKKTWFACSWNSQCHCWRQN